MTTRPIVSRFGRLSASSASERRRAARFGGAMDAPTVGDAATAVKSYLLASSTVPSPENATIPRCPPGASLVGTALG